MYNKRRKAFKSRKRSSRKKRYARGGSASIRGRGGISIR